jgi:hypothetical protein
VSFLAIRLAERYIHPVVLTRDPKIENEMLASFVVCLAGMLTLAGALYLVELAGKRADARLKELRERLA